MTEVYIKLAVSFCLSLGLLLLTNKIARRFYTLRFITGYYTFQFAALLLYLIVDSEAPILNRDFPNMLIRGYVDETIFGYFTFQVGVLAAAGLGVFLFSGIRKKIPFTEYIKQRHQQLALPLTFCALIILTHPFLSSAQGIGFASTVLFNFLSFIPFAAGVLFFYNKKLRLTWLLALSVLFVLGIMTGGRGTAVNAGALFAIGFYYALETVRAKRTAVVAGILIGIPLVSFLAFVGIFRHMVGRVDFDQLSWERAVQIYEKYEKLKDTKALNLNTQDAQVNGWGRFVNIVNIFQFGTIPSKKEHLGFDNLFTVDLPYAFDVAFISGSTNEDRLRVKANVYRLNDYGYGITLGSSVEYSIVTDSYIRLGWLGIFVFAAIVALFSQFMEFLVHLISKKNPALQVMAIIMLCHHALLGYAYNLFPTMRNMIVAVAAAVAITALLQFFKILFKKPKARRADAAATSFESP